MTGAGSPHGPDVRSDHGGRIVVPHATFLILAHSLPGSW